MSLTPSSCFLCSFSHRLQAKKQINLYNMKVKDVSKPGVLAIVSEHVKVLNEFGKNDVDIKTDEGINIGNYEL